MTALLIALALGLAVLGGALWRTSRSLQRIHAAARREMQRAQNLESLLFAIPQRILVYEADGRSTEWFTDSDTTSGRALIAALSADQRETFDTTLRQTMDDGQRREMRFTLADRHYAAEFLTYLPNASKPRVGLAILHDVTQQERSAARIRKLADRNKAILESAMDGFFIMDENGQFLEVNEAFCSMVGYSADELYSLRISDLEVDETTDGLGGSSRIRTGLHHLTSAHRHKLGHVIHLETSIKVLPRNAPKILVGFARDVTERLRDQQALERLSRQNKLLLDSAGEGIYGLDSEGRATFMNPAAARMLGWQLDEVLGQPVHEWVTDPEGLDTSAGEQGCALRQVLESGLTEHRSDEMFWRKDRSSFPVDYVCAPIREHLRVTGAVVVFRDISERKRSDEERRRLETRIQQVQKLESLGVLAGGLAHDFNNLLLSILCNASLGMERVAEDSETREHFDKIVKAGRRASELTRQMLAYSGQAPSDVQPLDLNERVHEVIDFMRAALPKTVELETSLASNLPKVEADSAQLQQVIVNLLINGSEAVGKEPGTVTICTGTRDLTSEQLAAEFAGYEIPASRYVFLHISDTGCGIAAEDLPRIFEPFYSTKATGRGLGLSAILGIVRSHGGAVNVSSKPGVGTTFTVLLPAMGAPAAAGEPVEGLKSLPAGALALVIDDEEDILDVVEAVLQSRNVTVLTAADGPTGIEIFRERATEIDVVLLDMMMPGMSGESVIRELLAIRPDARVILSSGYSEQEMITNLGDVPIAGFVHKPYTAETLVDKIGTVLA